MFLPRSSFPALALIGAAVLALAGAVTEAGAISSSSIYSPGTFVVYNTNVPESYELAVYYAEEREIPDSNIIGITVPAREEISRDEYQEMIAKPLRDVFTGNQSWRIHLAPGEGMRVIANKVQIVALMYGVPLKVKSNAVPKKVVDRATGTETMVPVQPMDTTGCSVDSELALLGNFGVGEGPSAAKNPYFEQNVSFYQARLPSMMLVGRIDGPTPQVARRLIDDAIAAEQTGLWGLAYFDLSGKYPKGDEWIRNSFTIYQREGFPSVLHKPSLGFPTNYPMTQAAVYFGWYARNVDGPFLHPDFRFRRGAVASHLHSFSAHTLRSTTKEWVGPLLDRGAAAVLGNVYEPYLDLTHHYDLFNERLLAGYTFIESAYMAIPALSWMSVAVGDPLYRPFANLETYEEKAYRKDENKEFKAFRLAKKRWAGEDAAQAEQQLSRAGAALDSGAIFEGMGLDAAAAGETGKAIALFDRAMLAYPEARDQLRVRLHQVEAERAAGDKDAAVKRLSGLAAEYASTPEAAAISAMMTEMKPPPPPMPPPPAPAAAP